MKQKSGPLITTIGLAISIIFGTIVGLQLFPIFSEITPGMSEAEAKQLGLEMVEILSQGWLLGVFVGGTLASLGFLLGGRPVFQANDRALMLRNISIWLIFTTIGVSGLMAVSMQVFLLVGLAFVALLGLMVAWLFMQAKDFVGKPARLMYQIGLVLMLLMVLYVTIAGPESVNPAVMLIPGILMSGGALASMVPGWAGFGIELRLRHLWLAGGLLATIAQISEITSLYIGVQGVVGLVQLAWLLAVIWLPNVDTTPIDKEVTEDLGNL